MMVVVQRGDGELRAAELVGNALYIAASAEKASSPELREARLQAAKLYATEALRGSAPVRPWGARSP